MTKSTLTETKTDGCGSLPLATGSVPSLEAWCLPTEINTHGKPHKVGGPYARRDDAEEANYLDQTDEPSPDKHDYWQWTIVAVPNAEVVHGEKGATP